MYRDNYHLRATYEYDRLAHRLTVERRRLREAVWFWRAVAATFAFLTLAMGYGYVMHWTGVW